MSNPHHENNVFVEFYSEPVEFKKESEIEGRPIFRDLAMVRIQVPGDRNNVIEVKASEHYQKRYPKAWAAFKAGEHSATTGTPLEQWPQITRSQAKEAMYFEVRTVEALAQLNETHCQKMGMGWVELRKKARDYLNITGATASETAQAAENERLRKEMEAMKLQIAALADVKPDPEIVVKRGRKPTPPKVAAEVE